MADLMDIVNGYVGVWNESEADERRRKIRSVWAPGGMTCYRLLDARGYEAIEARVTGSWNKWLKDGKYVFRPGHAACHHDVVKFGWVMVTLPAGEVEASGLSFLVLGEDGRIARDYQFNPAANDAGELVRRYLAIVNEGDALARAKKVGELWAPDGVRISATTTWKGRDAIERGLKEAHEAHVATGLMASPTNSSHGHHDVAMFKWQLRAKDTGRMAAGGSNFLSLDDRGLIRSDYVYDEP